MRILSLTCLHDIAICASDDAPSTRDLRVGAISHINEPVIFRRRHCAGARRKQLRRDGDPKFVGTLIRRDDGLARSRGLVSSAARTSSPRTPLLKVSGRGASR